METTQERIIVSVGGSLLVPEAIDTAFLARLKTLITGKVDQGFSFYIITGGGKICRTYQDAVRSIHAEVAPADLDWIGIAATRLNAEMVRSLFMSDTPRVIQDASEEIDTTPSILVAGGIEPGSSSDLAAVRAAKATGAKKLVNLSNIDYVYTADPRKDASAKKIEKISWADFRKLIPEEWNPGLSSPFDPIAAKEAEAMGLEVAVINGAHLEEFAHYLEGKPFVGTVIS